MSRAMVSRGLLLVTPRGVRGVPGTLESPGARAAVRRLVEMQAAYTEVLVELGAVEPRAKGRPTPRLGWNPLAGSAMGEWPEMGHRGSAFVLRRSTLRPIYKQWHPWPRGVPDEDSRSGACSCASVRAVLAAVTATSLAPFASAIAQQEADAQQGIEEIIVTAQKRDQSLQDVPLAITALSSSDIERLNASDVRDLQFATPNLVVVSSNAALPFFGIRGIPTSAATQATSSESACTWTESGSVARAPRTSPCWTSSRSRVLRGPRARCSERTPSLAPSTSPRASPAKNSAASCWSKRAITTTGGRWAR